MGANSEILILGRSPRPSSAAGAQATRSHASRPSAYGQRPAAVGADVFSRPAASGRTVRAATNGRPQERTAASGRTSSHQRFSAAARPTARAGQAADGRTVARAGRVAAAAVSAGRTSESRAARRRERQDGRPRGVRATVGDVAGRAGSSASGAVGWLAAHRALAIALAVVVAVVAFLYPPARAYYVAARNNATLAAKIADVNVSNERLQGQVDSLMTREGIEDAARELGYVYEGDTAVDMSGVDSSSATDASVDGSSSTADSAWYTPLLDFVFAYDASTQGMS